MILNTMIQKKKEKREKPTISLTLWESVGHLGIEIKIDARKYNKIRT